MILFELLLICPIRVKVYQNGTKTCSCILMTFPEVRILQDFFKHRVLTVIEFFFDLQSFQLFSSIVISAMIFSKRNMEGHACYIPLPVTEEQKRSCKKYY